MGTRTTRIRRTNADFFLDIYCRSILIPLLQLEEGCPKGGVVGERKVLNVLINRYFIAYLPPPPTGTPPPTGGGE